MHKKSKKTPSSRKPYTFKRVSENLYKVTETGGYYALVKRGGKQIRRSLKTTDKALAKRRLAIPPRCAGFAVADLLER